MSTRVIRLFVSSTFRDFVEERRALQEQVFPKLAGYCAARGARFQAVDLRWGISEDTARDQQTMAICLQEIARCQQQSPSMNFLALVGDRQGWLPLPAQIQSQDFESMCAALVGAGASRRDLRLISRWYVRDDNAVPPVHSLRPPGPALATTRWDAIERRLRALLGRAAWLVQMSARRRLALVGSATAQEIEKGVFESAGTGAFCVMRRIVGLPRDTRADAHIDLDRFGRPDNQAREQLRRLRRRLRRRLPGRLLSYAARWDAGGISTDHIGPLCVDLERLLQSAIDRALVSGSEGSWLAQERLSQRAFAAARSAIFIGRGAALDRVERYLSGPARRPLVVVGPSGSGKSALVARIAQDLEQRWRHAAIVYRFAGATASSASALQLLLGLIREIESLYGLEPGPPPMDLDEHGRELSRRLHLAAASHPLVLLLDGLDQISGPAGTEDLLWLPTELPRHVHVVLSLLPGRRLDRLRKALPGETLVELNPMSPAEGGDLLDAWLNADGRRLTPPQRGAVLARFSREGSPLHLALAFAEARRWHSGDAAPVLPTSVPGIIRVLLRRLSAPANHGHALVSRALAYLAGAKEGLADDEIIGVLSTDRRVMSDFRGRSPHSPRSSVLPDIVWARLRADLSPYLRERDEGGIRLLGFFHRQLDAVVRSRWLPPDAARVRHRHLSAYFGGRVLLARDDDPHSADRRRMAEQPFHEAFGGMHPAALFDPVFVAAKLAVMGPMALVEDLDRARATAAPSHRAVRRALRDLEGAFSGAAHILTSDPFQLPGQLLGRLAGRAGAPLQRFLSQAGEGAFGPWLRPRAATLAPVDGPVARSFNVEGGGMCCLALSTDGRRMLVGSDAGALELWDVEHGFRLRALRHRHKKTLRAVALTPGELVAVTASDDGTLGLWDLLASRRRRVLLGHEGWVNDVAIDAAGRLIVSVSSDRTVRVWDLTSGRLIHTLEGHEDRVFAVALSPDGRRAITGGEDGTLRVWDLPAGRAVHRLRPGGEILSVAITWNGRVGAAVSADGVLTLWDLESGARRMHVKAGDGRARHVAVDRTGRWGLVALNEHISLWDLRRRRRVRELVGHTDSVSDLKLAPNGSVAVSASFEGVIKVWRPLTPAVLHRRPGHAARVRGVALSPDGQRVLSVGDDCTLILWSATDLHKLRILSGHRSRLTSVVFSPDGRHAVYGCGRDVFVWGIGDRSRPRRLAGHASWVNSVAVSPDGRTIVSGSHDRTVRLWDLATGRSEGGWSVHSNYVRAVAVTPDARLVISASSDRRLRMFDLDGARPPRVLRGRLDRARSIAPLPNGRLLVASGDHTVQVWDLARGGRVAVLSGHTGFVKDVAASGDGRLAVSASEDGTVKLWELSSRSCLATFTGEAPMSACALLADGRLIAAGEDSGRVHLLVPEGRRA